MTTHIYIDVDGVINSFRKSTSAGWEGDWELAKVIGFQIHWYTDLVEELNKLSVREDVQMFWLTTWQDNAVEFLCPALGIEGTDWPVLYAGDDSLFDLRDWWKLKAIRTHASETNPDKIVWIDDDIKYDHRAIQWIGENDHVHGVSPFSDWGLTKEDFDGIVEFVTEPLPKQKETNDES